MAIDVMSRRGALTVIVGDASEIGLIYGVLPETDLDPAYLIMRRGEEPDHRVRLARGVSPNIGPQVALATILPDGTFVTAELVRTGSPAELVRMLSEVQMREVLEELIACDWNLQGFGDHGDGQLDYRPLRLE